MIGRKRIMSAVFFIGALLVANFAECAVFPVTTPAEFQTALTTAQANGQDDIINVTAGTYNIVTTLTYSTSENFDLTITGAGSATTILDGGTARQCLNMDSTGDGAISVSGLTIRNGRAATLGGGLAVTCANGAISLLNCSIINNVSDRSAGGAYLGGFNGNITVDSCIVDGNSLDPVTGDDGGGLDIYVNTNGTANITLTNSVITDNYIGECPSAVGSPDGAGVFMYHLGAGSTITVTGNTISNNTALGGPAGFYIRIPISTTFIFEDNTISGNASGRPAVGVSGGGIHLHLESATLRMTNNIVLNNQAIGPYANGGGLDLLVTGGTCEITGNVFAGNTAQQHGGGASVNIENNVTSARLMENLFVNNQAGLTDGSGGGLSLNSEANVSLINNTSYHNTANEGGGMTYYATTAADTVSMFNEIYWGNTPNSVVQFDQGPIQATYSNIQGGTGQPYFGTGCIDTDPLFFNTASPQGADGIYATIDDGLHLTALSPSFNTGSTAAVPPALTLDIAGQARTQGGTVDMGAYEGVAGTPTAYNLTMAVAPAGSGTTTPAAGTHSLTSPSAIAAAANAGYAFVNWTVTAGTATVLAPNSESTSATFSTDCTITANFVEIPATATLTMAASPLAGGSTNPAVGAHPGQATQVPIAIVATPAEGYSFINWTKTGSVTIANSASATTTATLLNNATVTANFLEVPDSVNLMFIHHSVGQNWLDSGLRDVLEAKVYVNEVNEITYADVVAPDAGRPSSLGAVPGDSTDMATWLYWFNDYFDGIQAFECTSGTNRIIMFKSCFPNSHIAETGTGNGDPFDTTHSIVNHQAVYRNVAGAGTPYSNGGYNYLALEDVFAANPDILFIPITAPPECYAEATATTGANTRIFNDWLKNTWLPAYNAAHPGLNNVAVFDFFDFLSNADTGVTYSNMLKAANGGESGDSHPNETANTAATVLYATGTPNFIDLVWARFTGAASQHALTMVANPIAGGVIVPVAGTADSYTPLVISAAAAEGYRFVNWTISPNGQVYNTDSHITTLLMSGATTATANFAAVPYMTLGSTTTVTIEDLIGFTGTAFGGKPSPSATYTDPTSATPKTKKAGLKSTFDKAHNTEFIAEWTKKQALFNKKDIPAGTNSMTYLGDNPLDSLICEFSVKAAGLAADGSKIRAATYGAGQIFVPPPEITGIQDQTGTLIVPPVVVAPGATIYLVGTYFGCKAPNVWFEYLHNGRIKQTKCKVLKNLFSPLFPDSKNKPSCMNCETGASRVPVQIPTKIPEGEFLPFIVIDNGIGRDTVNLTVE